MLIDFWTCDVCIGDVDVLLGGLYFSEFWSSRLQTQCGRPEHGTAAACLLWDWVEIISSSENNSSVFSAVFDWQAEWQSAIAIKQGAVSISYSSATTRIDHSCHSDRVALRTVDLLFCSTADPVMIQPLSPRSSPISAF